MVNHKHKFVYIHVPKTAGCSIGRTLYKSLNIVDKRYEGFKIHHDYLTKEILEEYFVFTFVRNPWDRIWSQYKFRPFLFDYYPFNDVVPNLEKHFKEYYITDVENPHERVRFNTAQLRADWYAEFVHLPTQTEFLKGKYNDGIDKFPYLDYVGRFENLQNDFDNICEKIGIAPVKLPHENISPTINDSWSNPIEPTPVNHYSEVYSEKNIEYIRKKYNDDIMNFNYEYEKI